MSEVSTPCQGMDIRYFPSQPSDGRQCGTSVLTVSPHPLPTVPSDPGVEGDHRLEHQPKLLKGARGTLRRELAGPGTLRPTYGLGPRVFNPERPDGVDPGRVPNRQGLVAGQGVNKTHTQYESSMSDHLRPPVPFRHPHTQTQEVGKYGER